MYVEKLDIGEVILPDFEAWKQNGIYSKRLDALIAPEDLWIKFDGDEWKYFNPYDLRQFEEYVLKPNGWRLPSDDEWLAILKEFGTKEGETDLAFLMEQLGLIFGGYVEEKHVDDYNVCPHDPSFVHNVQRSGCYAASSVSDHTTHDDSVSAPFNRYFYYLKERDPIYGVDYIGVCGTVAQEAYRVRCISVK